MYDQSSDQSSDNIYSSVDPLHTTDNINLHNISLMIHKHQHHFLHEHIFLNSSRIDYRFGYTLL